jgi:outer membrane lipoprotein-sorting protein
VRYMIKAGMGWLAAATALMQLCLPIYAQESLLGRAKTAAPDGRSVGEDQIFADLIARNQARSEALLEYIDTRTYRVGNLNGKVHAQIEGKMEFHAPGGERFVITSEQGSGVIRRLALHPLIASEIKAAAGKDRHDSAITPANYTLELIGEETVGAYRCYVLRAIPKRVDKYLFEGKVWVDQHDFAVVRIEGRPAARLSFWIKRADFIREYGKIGGFWLPQRDETVVDVRFYGKAALTIDHGHYAVRGVPLPMAAAEIR